MGLCQVHVKSSKIMDLMFAHFTFLLYGFLADVDTSLIINFVRVRARASGDSITKYEHLLVWVK